ncbi:hypothetical protein NB689_003408 [Xanthomonas sacchari]|nr:hypothetical protein [Xanthomonas sacchari]
MRGVAVERARGVQRGEHVDPAERAQAAADPDHPYAMTIDARAAADADAELVQFRAVHHHGVRFAQRRAQGGAEQTGEHQPAVAGVDAGDVDRHRTGVAGAAPVAVEPDERLDLRHPRVQVQRRGRVRIDGAALVHALRAGIAQPQVGVGAGHIDAGAAEDAQHQRGLQQQQQAGEAHRHHYRQEAAPLVAQGLAGQRDHQGCAPSWLLTAPVPGIGAVALPSAVCRAT